MPSDQDLKINIKFNGATSVKGDKGDVDLNNGNYVQQFQVDQQLGMPDYCKFQLQSTEFNEIIFLDAIKPGDEIELKVGYEVEDVIFKGEISYIEPFFSAGEMYINISGFDGTHRLTRGTSSRTFGDGHEVNQNFGDVLKTLIGDSKSGASSDGLSADSASTESQSSYIAHYNSNLYEIISRTAGSFGLDWKSGSHADAKKLSLKPIEKGSPVLTICRDKYNPDSEMQAVSAEFLCSTVKQVSKVIVRSWDTAAKKAIKGEAEAASLVIGGTPGYEQAGKAHAGSASSGRIIEVTDIPVASVGEANEVAAGILTKLSMDWMKSTVVIDGRPDVHAGDIVDLKEFGVRYSGEYLVEGCTHKYIAGGGTPYTTTLHLARNGSPEP